jgi:hypothetical protein
LAKQAADTHGSVDLTESPRPLDPEFYYFAATRASGTGSPMVGYYAVNPWTGDVWDVNGCNRIESSSLKKRQREIRRQSGIRNSVYEKLRVKKPLCIGSSDHD